MCVEDYRTPSNENGGFLKLIHTGLLLLLVTSQLCFPVLGQENPWEAGSEAQPTRKLTYKKLAGVSLQLHVFEPEGHSSSDRRPTIVFFFGGGWNGGTPTQFYPHSVYLATRGMLAISAEYRVKTRNNTSPAECVKDGKSAMRWVRRHAGALGADPDRLAAGGGSAGGHVAAATATIKNFNEDAEDESVSAVPNALVLFNPVYDNGPEGYGYDRVKDYWQRFSPAHNIGKGMPPAIVFLGTKDTLIPVRTAEKFKQDMERVGSRSELQLFDGEGHGFFNFGRGDNSNFIATVAAMDRFLSSLGYLKGQPTIH